MKYIWKVFMLFPKKTNYRSIKSNDKLTSLHNRAISSA